MANTDERLDPLERELADVRAQVEAEMYAEAEAERKANAGGAHLKKGGKKKTGLIVGVVALIAVLGVAVAVMADRLNLTGIDDDGVPLRNVVTTEEEADAALDSLLGNLEVPTSYRVRMSTTWTFRSGTSASEDAYVENADTNETDVYFDVTLADTGELIYESPVLPVDTHIRNITLDKALGAGTYDCVCTYHLVDEEQNTLSTVSMALTIVVQS